MKEVEKEVEGHLRKSKTLWTFSIYFPCFSLFSLLQYLFLYFICSSKIFSYFYFFSSLFLPFLFFPLSPPSPNPFLSIPSLVVCHLVIVYLSSLQLILWLMCFFSPSFHLFLSLLLISNIAPFSPSHLHITYITSITSSHQTSLPTFFPHPQWQHFHFCNVRCITATYLQVVKHTRASP